MAGRYEDDPDRKFFADLLREWREARGLTRDELGVLAGFSGSTIKAFESCERAASVYHATRLDQALRLKRILERAAERFGQDEAYSATMEMFLAGEQEADELYWFEHSLVPGLLQTEDYARSVLSTWPGVTSGEVEKMVAARLARQRVMLREPRPPYLWALIDEGALERPVAPAPVMYDQCARLVEASYLPNVSLSVVPYRAGGHTGLLGACVIAERREAGSMVYTEDIADGRVSEDPARVADVSLRFKSLQLEALPKGDSREMIARVAERRWKTAAPAGGRALTAATTAGPA
jgi:transcriptional regulator with XRE-family HTH domain